MTDGIVAIVRGLATLAEQDVHSMPEPALLVSTESVLTARAKLDAILVRQVQGMDVREVSTNVCGRTTKAWLVEEQRLSPTEATRLLWVARRVPSHPAIGDALDEGQISLEHARVILGCLRKLPPEWRDKTEPDLLSFARDHDPALLAALCQQVVVMSGADESAEAAALRKYDSRHLTLSPTFEGMLSINGMLDPESAATLNAALAPLLRPAGEVDDRTPTQRRADALTDLARMALAHGDLPDHGGEHAQIVATLPFNELRDALEASQTGTATLGGPPITPDTVRRLACDAGIIPAVLGSQNEVLNLGRSTPTWSRAQRRARRLEDNGCVFPKCQATLDRCQIHHLRYWWEHHGPTDHNNGAHLCHYHHWLVHHTDWTITRNAKGHIEVYRTGRQRT